jgi:hypothetical protein
MNAKSPKMTRFLLHFFPLFVFLLIGFIFAWSLSTRKQKHDAQTLITQMQDSRQAQIRARILRLDQSMKMIVHQSYFLDDFRSLQEAFPRYALERRVKSPLPVLRTLLNQHYKGVFEEHPSSKLAKTRVEDNVNLLSESSLAAQINYLQRAKGETRDFVNDGTRWSEIHARRLNDWKLWIETLGAENLHWVDVDRHDLFFSVSKNLEFATSLKYGPFADAHLAKFVSQVLASPKNTETLLSDMEEELIRWDEPRVYLGLPVDEDGRRMGAIVVEFSPEKLKKLLGTDQIGAEVTSEFVVDSADYNFWVPPAIDRHPARSTTDNEKLQLLDWMEVSRTRSGAERWVPFVRDDQEWWGAVKPLKIFNRDLWIINEYPKNEFERPALFSKAQFQLAFVIGFFLVAGFAGFLSAYAGGRGALPTTPPAETPAPDNVTVLRVNGNPRPTPEAFPFDWELLEQPLQRADRQLKKEFEKLNAFSELLQKRHSEILSLEELCRKIKDEINGHRGVYDPLLASVEDKAIPQDNLRFPASWIESLGTSIRKLEVLCFSFALEIKKGGSPENYKVLLEEFEGLQKKLQREAATVEKWSLQTDDPVQRFPIQSLLVEFSESFKSLFSSMDVHLAELSQKSETAAVEFESTLKTFGDLKQTEGLSTALVAIQASVVSLKTAQFSRELASTTESEDLESLFKEVEAPRMPNGKKVA